MPKSKRTAAASPASPMGRLLGVLGLLTALLASMLYLAEKNLDKFYIFDLDELHDVSKRGLAKHGNDTRAVVKYIVDDLHKTHGAHVNLHEDWVFNNAGGAMGAMYIIHASESSRHTMDLTAVADNARHYRVSHHFR
jgi:C-8 sterol isomerase